MSSVLDFPPALSVTAAVEDLKAAVGSVATLVAAGHLELLSASELLEVTADVQALSSQLDAVAVSTVAEVRDGEVGRCEGFTSTTAWLEARAGLSKGQSRSCVALGEKLQWEFEATRDAWLAGEIGEGVVQAITTLIPKRLRGLPESDYVAARTDLEAMALHHARTGTVAEVRRAIDRAAIVADPVGADAAVTAAKESQFLSFTPVPDGVEVRGFLSTETAAVVLTAFDQCHDARYRNGALATDADDDAARDARDRVARTPGARKQRREHHNAEILAELVTHLLDDGALGTKHAQRPHLTVTVHSDDYTAGLGGDILLPGFGSVPVPNATIDRLLCDAEVHPVLTRRPGPPPGPPSSVSRGVAGADEWSDPSRVHPGSVPGSTDPPWRPPLRPRPGGGWEVVIDPDEGPTAGEIAADTDVAAIAEFSDDLDDQIARWNRFRGERPRHVLDVGRSWRTAPPKIRHALTVRDGGCAVPGCDTDPSRCEAHHIDHWENGGDTSLANMVLLCSRHHHRVHEGRWHIRRDEHLDPGDQGYITLISSTHSSQAPHRRQLDASPIRS